MLKSSFILRMVKIMVNKLSKGAEVKRSISIPLNFDIVKGAQCFFHSDSEECRVERCCSIVNHHDGLERELDLQSKIIKKSCGHNHFLRILFVLSLFLLHQTDTILTNL